MEDNRGNAFVRAREAAGVTQKGLAAAARGRGIPSNVGYAETHGLPDAVRRIAAFCRAVGADPERVFAEALREVDGADEGCARGP